MSTRRPQASIGDELSNLGIGLLVCAAVLTLLLRAAGAVAAWATGIARPVGGPESRLAVLLDPGNPAAVLQAPGLNRFAFWVTAILLVGLASAAAFWLWRIFRGAVVTTTVDSHRIAGIATRTEVARAVSKTAILKRAAHLRPSLIKAGPTDIGYQIGRSGNTAVWASVEDSILAIGPSRSGKGAHGSGWTRSRSWIRSS
ncbi:hypothetical protein [Cryobacterium aureum]|uniref:hypothetical protein n=1 Tax=Cryobacterium aureum TaxID=995037 RepID=UPI000CF407E9|nr:hypothetical protein [Cryobacterium aureum]